MCTCLSQVALKAFKHLAHCHALYRTIYWLIYSILCMSRSWFAMRLFVVTSIPTMMTSMTTNASHSIVYSGIFFNLFSKHFLLCVPACLSACMCMCVHCATIFSTGIYMLCALNTQFISSMKFISLWLFNGFLLIFRCYFRWNSGC